MFRKARVTSSAMEMSEVLDVLERGLRSMQITVFPICFSACALSPSSSGTRMTSAPPIPAEVHFPRSESSPGMRASGSEPSTSPAPAFSNSPVIFLIRSSVL